MRRPMLIWNQLRATFWFVPANVVLGSMAAAAALVELDSVWGLELAGWSPRLFGAGVEGSRAMLSAIATSMITVAGVVFSITIVALSLTSTQYSPRVLRNFMRDTPTQLVLGVFLGIFAYCLVVLRTIRGSDELDFIPSVAVLAGMVYAFTGLGLLIYFIHHVSESIQAASILGRIAQDTAQAIDRMFPDSVGGSLDPGDGAPVLPDAWTPVTALATGYVVSIDGDALMDVATKTGRMVRLAPGMGAFVAEGAVLLTLSGSAAVDEDLQDQLRGAVFIASQRTIEQDAAFGLQQLVDVALRALSPGINDPTTACMSIDRVGELLGRLSGREMPTAYRLEGGVLRVIVPTPSFGTIAALTLAPILEHSRGDLQVLQRLACVVASIEARADLPERRLVIRRFSQQLRRELHGLGRTPQRQEMSRQLLAAERALRLPRGPSGD